MPITTTSSPSLTAGGPPAHRPGTPADNLRAMLAAGELDLPDPGRGATPARWAALAAWGRDDLPLARLAEGHADAVAILQELGAPVHPGVTYGVWAARPGGHGVRLTGHDVLEGTARFCSGAHLLDRALVVVDTPGGTRLVDVDLADPAVQPQPADWAAPGMRASDTGPVRLDGVAAPAAALIGPPGGYVERPGFSWGGGGVAAVWLGGAAGVLDDLLSSGTTRDAHALAHLGALHAAVQAADALLVRTAVLIDDEPDDGHAVAVATARAAVEQACRAVLDRAPLAGGVAGLAGSPTLAQRLADLQVFVRQHHGERDLAELGAAVAGRR